MSSDPRCRETGPFARHAAAGLALAAAFLVASIGADALSASPEVPREVVIDMASGWLRRDWQGCSDPTRITFGEGAIAFESRSSSALVWQVPTPNGPFVIDPALDWVRECDRPPISFFRRLAGDRGTAMLPDLSEVPHLVWRWRVEGAIDDWRSRAPTGGSAAATTTSRRSWASWFKSREARAPTRSLTSGHARPPLGTLLYQETTVIPVVFKARAARLVVETGEGRGAWVAEEHDLRADFARLVPGKQAGRVLRLHLMTDSDDTGGHVTAAYADIRFVRPIGMRPALADAVLASPAPKRP